MQSNKSINDIARRVGAEYGYEDVSAEFHAYQNLKIAWTRNAGGTWATFGVSDYLMGAGDDIIEELMRAIYLRIDGDRDTARVHMARVKEWCAGNLDGCLFAYVARCRAMEVHSDDVKALASRLRAKGRIPEGFGVYERAHGEPTGSRYMRAVILTPSTTYKEACRLMDRLMKEDD